MKFSTRIILMKYFVNLFKFDIMENIKEPIK